MSTASLYSRNSGDDRFTPKIYFPRVPLSTDSIVPNLVEAGSERPKKVDPIFDTEHAHIPLRSYDAEIHTQIYHGPDLSGVAGQPPIPASFKDAYVYPCLTKDEYQRLTTVWYYTQGIEDDKHFLFTLNHLLQTFQKAMGWEFAIAGILDEATYTRLAAVNLPVAVLPRRESTCSHTVNQDIGSVFMITDMSQDWRFRLSPHVEVGGLRSYAGTQLKVPTNHGDMTALGSLCIASNSTRDPLSEKERANLIAIADVIVDQMRNRVFKIRMAQRQRMSDVILTLKDYTNLNLLELKMLDLLQQIYPDEKVTLQDVSDQCIVLTNRPSVAPEDFEGGLWEDTEHVIELINTENAQRLHTEQSVRVMTARCGSFQKYLVVDSTSMRHIFDDFDCWFIERCATIYTEKLQTQLLQQALQAKDKLLRSITHQLRTPVHGILGSVDLLAEDLSSRNLLLSTPACDSSALVTTPLTAYLSAIRSSGSELMMTINDIIKLNVLSASLNTNTMKSEDYDLQTLETDILVKMLENEGIAQSDRLSIRTTGLDKRLLVSLDAQRLRDCVAYLLLNAIQATMAAGGGTVTMVVSTKLDESRLEVDVTDTGAGISLEDQQCLYESHDMVGDVTSDVSIGLTLARRFAEHLDGSITLVTSELGRGSTFRASFPLRKVLSLEETIVVTQPPAPDHIQWSFDIAEHQTRHSHMVDHISQYLLRRGLQRAQSQQNPTLFITDRAPDRKEFFKNNFRDKRPMVVISYCPAWSHKAVWYLSDWCVVILLTGSLHRVKLDQMLTQAEVLYGELKKILQMRLEADEVQQVDKTNEPLVETKSRPDQSVKKAAPPTLTSSPFIAVKTIGTALLVDDNSINLRILRIYCDKRSIPYATATDGNEAIKLYTQYLTATPESVGPDTDSNDRAVDAVTQPTSRPVPGSVGLILMDLQMPNCSGIEATIAIRSLEKQKSLRPSVIFMITGQDSMQDRNSSLAAGVNEFLVKPVRMSILDGLIEKYLSVEAVESRQK